MCDDEEDYDLVGRGERGEVGGAVRPGASRERCRLGRCWRGASAARRRSSSSPAGCCPVRER